MSTTTKNKNTVMPNNWVFLRGMSRNSHHWGSFPKNFEKHFGVKVFCLDLPGFGLRNTLQSPLSISKIADVVEEDILALNLNESALGILGISLGGMVGIELAARLPKIINRIVLINSSIGSLSPSLKRIKLSAVPKLVASSRMSIENREKTILGITCNDPKVRLKLLASWCKADEKFPYKPSNVLRQLRAAASYKSTPKVLAKGLILASKEDQLVSSQCSKDIAAHYLWPIKTHSWAGHDLVLDDPSWTLSAIAESL